MTMHAKGTIETKGWDEKTWEGVAWDEVEGAQRTRASVKVVFHGDVKGESVQEYVMSYRDDGSANFVGMEQVVGRIGERSGSFVLQHSGTYEDGVMKSAWFVVPGSGTGELSGLRGEGTYLFDGQHGDPTHYTFDYEFE